MILNDLKINRQRGSILIFALLILTSMMLMSGTLLKLFLPKLRIVKEAIYSADAIYAADSAVEWCLDNNSSWPPSIANLVGHWAFDTGSGIVAIDSSGSNYNGALINGPTWTYDKKIGLQAVSLDGGDDSVILPANAPLLSPGAGNFSLALWAKFTSLPVALDVLMVDGDATLADSWFLVVGANNTLACGYKDGTTTVSVSTPVNDISTRLGQWVHYACVRQGTSVYFYENGVSLGTSSNSLLLNIATNNGLNPMIGALASGVLTAPAIIDDVRVYNRALSVDEVQSLIPKSPPTMANGATLQVYFPSTSTYSTTCTEPIFDHRIVGTYRGIARSLEVH